MRASITHILPAAAIRRERLMSAGGRIIARRGQQVSPFDTVAEAVLHPEHLLLDIGRGLGLSPKEASNYIQRRAGDELEEGDVIAGPVGIGRRVVRAPRPGRIVIVGEGQVLLELEGEYSELKAGYFGTVTEILDSRGVAIEAAGALVQGVWGNGKINFGLLNILAHAPGDIVSKDRIEVSLRGAVVMAGICDDESVLRLADELPIRGMVLASMDASLVEVALEVSYPVVLIEGFGRLPMNQEAFSILSSAALRQVSLNAEPWDRIGNARPEVVMSLPEGASASLPTEWAELSIGQAVRVVSAPYKSMLGTLADLPRGSSILPNGMRAQTAEVQLTSGEKVQVPLANLEIIG